MESLTPIPELENSLGHKQTKWPIVSMSASGGKADIVGEISLTSTQWPRSRFWESAAMISATACRAASWLGNVRGRR